MLRNKMFPSDTRSKQSPVGAVCNKIILIRKEGVSVFWTFEAVIASKSLAAKCASWELCWEFRKLREWSRILQVFEPSALQRHKNLCVVDTVCARKHTTKFSKRENLILTLSIFPIPTFDMKCPISSWNLHLWDWNGNGSCVKVLFCRSSTFEGKLDRF